LGWDCKTIGKGIKELLAGIFCIDKSAGLGSNRTDHYFGPETVLKAFGIILLAYNEEYFYFTDINVTADIMIDALEDLWSNTKTRFNPNTIIYKS